MTAVSAPPVAPRRSLLYLPGSNLRALEKARTLPCDGVILDLEDAVAPDAKTLARDQVAQALAVGGFGRREVVVRINGLDTPWGEADLERLAQGAPDAILVPKVEDAGDIARYDARLTHLPDRVRLWAMVETCRCLFHLDAIAGAARSSRLNCLVMGTNDLAEAIGVETDAQSGPDRPTARRAPLWTALSLTVAAARAHGLSVLDGVYNALDDAAGLARECDEGRGFGFDGKTLIHPAQIEACNHAFSPSARQIAAARAVVDAFAQPDNQDAGAIRLDGRMVERLHLARAERLLALADAITDRAG